MIRSGQRAPVTGMGNVLALGENGRTGRRADSAAAGHEEGRRVVPGVKISPGRAVVCG